MPATSSVNSLAASPTLTGENERFLHVSPSTLHDRRLAKHHHHPLKQSHRIVRPDTGAVPEARLVQRPTVHGFMPLPPISASPICTPTVSISTPDLTSSGSVTSGSEKDRSTSSSTEEYATAPGTPSDIHSFRTLLPPTWISTPPTPPPKLFRRSVTCMPHAATAQSLSPSISFPVPLASTRIGFEHVAKSLSRRASHPSMSPRHYCSDPSTLLRKDWGSDAVSVASPLRMSLIANVQAPVDEPLPKPSFRVFHRVSSDDGEENKDINTRHREIEEVWRKEKTKDDTRKYHALMELLSTEVAYLMDLRILILVYLRALPTLTLTMRTSATSTFGRSSSFTALTRSGSVAHLPSYHAFDIQPFTSIHPKEKPKTAPRNIFTQSEVEVLTRNAEEVLTFHEHFVAELRMELMPLGFLLDPHHSSEQQEADEGAQRRQEQGLRNVDEGISIVSTKFATESSRFNSYTSFCAGHPEALDVLRRIQSQHPVEWAAFEQRSSALALSMSDGDNFDLISESVLDIGMSSQLPSSENEEKEGSAKGGRRVHSSTESATRGLRPRGNGTASTESSPDSRRSKQAGRLIFLDYMIKPIQRICKYPLLLDQLRAGKALRSLSPQPVGQSDLNVVVESATQAMRHVASLVDEARYRQGVIIQSSLIVSRICSATPVPSSTARSPLDALTSSFLSSLGVCLLAGSLDVLHHRGFRPAASTTNAKYLGAFLYLGGYLILVKVGKGKVYEPRHWFRLADFQLVNVGEEDAMLPYSFRLSCKTDSFELAAACQREKVAWMTSIHESLSHPTSNWINEPIPSLYTDGRAEMAHSILDDPPEAFPSLPTIQSIPELSNNARAQEISDTVTEDTFRPQFTRDSSFKSSEGYASTLNSRRSSSTSVKAMFLPLSSESDTILIRRSSPSGRARVDSGLQDVISEPCVTARSYATSREEELFQAPTITRIGHPTRSGSSLNMAGRLKKHDSVRVPRRKSLVGPPDESSRRKTIATRTKSLTSRSRPRKLSISSTNLDGDPIFFLSRPDSAASPSPFSQPSSGASSKPPSLTGSVGTSPVGDTPFLNQQSADLAHEQSSRRRGSRPNSLVSNVRGIFFPRPISPSTHPSPDTARTPTDIIKRWVKGPRHRRSHSAPDSDAQAVNDDLNSSELSELRFGAELTLTESPEEARDSQSTLRVLPENSRRRSMVSFL